MVKRKTVLIVGFVIIAIFIAIFIGSGIWTMIHVLK